MDKVFKKQKPDTEVSDKIVIGAYVPLSLVEFTKLYAMDKKVSHASVIEKLMVGLKTREEKEGIDIHYLISSLANTAINTFNTLNTETTIQKRTFLAALKKELVSKGISQKVVDEILTIVSDGTN